MEESGQNLVYTRLKVSEPVEQLTVNPTQLMDNVSKMTNMEVLRATTSRGRQLGSNSPRLMVKMCRRAPIKVKVGLCKGCNYSCGQQVSGSDRRYRIRSLFNGFRTNVVDVSCVSAADVVQPLRITSSG